MSEIVSNLKKWAKLDNIAEKGGIDKEVLDKLGARVLFGFNHDLDSMSEWLADVKKVEEIASLVSKKKNRPLPNSANIKYPLITKAGYEFSSRTYPEIVKDGKVVKGRVIGLDFTQEKQERCDRVSAYMNYQLLYKDEEWELELDRLLTLLSLIGFICKKTWFDPVRKVVRSDICDYKDLIINSDVKSLQDARRVSHVIHLRLNDLIENAAAGVYLQDAVDELVEQHCEDELDPKIDIIEQHCFADLDEDDYAEPYIITIIKESGKILRIAPRFTSDMVIAEKGELKYVDALQLFTDFHFLVSPKGKFQSVGFGTLMLHINETINTLLNQLVDAGQLANLQGGYKDSRLKNMGSGDSNHNPGEWKTVKAMAGASLKDGIVPIQYKEPSSVLFQLLGLMIEAGKDLSSSSEVMTGSTSADNAKTGAVQALQAQGLKIFTSIQRRIYRSLTGEVRKIYRLDSIHISQNEYFILLDQPKVVQKDDFDLKSVDILPVADPNLSSDVQRSARNQILIAAQALPGTNKIMLSKLVLQNANLGIPVEEIMLPPEALNQPDPNMIKIQAEIQSWSEDKKLKAHELEIKQFEAETERYKVECQCLELKAKAILEISQAQTEQQQGKFRELELQLETLQTHLGAVQHAAEFGQTNAMHGNEMNMRQQEIDQQRAADANQQQADQGVAGEPSNSTPTE